MNCVARMPVGAWVVGVVLMASACGNEKGDASVAACESWLDTMVCGETDYTAEFDCQIYGEERCDVAGYFYCLEQNTECDSNSSTFDLSGWDVCQGAAICAD